MMYSLNLIEKIVLNTWENLIYMNIEARVWNHNG